MQMIRRNYGNESFKQLEYFDRNVEFFDIFIISQKIEILNYSTK